MSSSNLRHWLSCGDVEKLENVVLDGKGIRLLGEQSSDLRTRVFLKGLPNYLTKIAQIHDAVSRGSLTEVRKLVDSEPKKKLVIAKDPAGTPLIHKAVYYDHQNILEWILNNYPITVDQKDREGRTALHYCAACRDPEAVWDLLIESGSDASVCDRRAKPAAYYLHHSNEIELPDPERMAGRRLRPRNAARSMTLDFKSSNIRIWIHNRDIGKLQHVLWEGHGSRLRCETSNNVRVKRFLDAVPFIMAAIKDIHTAVIKNDVEAFRQRVEDPVSPIILSSKDSNGLNVLHKAAGLGYGVMVKEILSRYPVIINSQDNDGKTPLHYAAICRDGGTMYDLLIVEGADETKVDNRQKMPSYYKNRPSDVDLSCLVMIPDAPRVGGTSFPRNWDWRIIDSDQPLRRPKRSKGHNSNNSNGDDDSAFDSGESTKLTEELATPEIENAEDELNGNEDDENADAEKAEEDDAGEPEDSNQAEDGPEAEASENPGPAEGEEPAAEADDNNNDETEAKPAETETEETGDDPQEEAPKEDEEKNEGESDTTAGEEEKNEEDNEDGKEDEAAENEGEKEENAEGGDADETEENNAQDKEDKKNDGDAEQNEEGEAAKEEETDEGAKEKTEENEEAKTEENEDQPDSGVGVTPNDEEQALIGGEESDPGPEQTAGELDEETAELLASGTMEQLAAIVLSGEGHRLVGRKSTDRDLQAFLNNVPNYMAKIQAVHKAAREGELKDLQTSLDRRKFAIAKDKSSPHGATPLHVAVIFGHTPVVRYLDSRFPETAHALDFDGRTPLHYAATINDNGHYYNLLLNLGANPLVQDNFGHKAAYYKENQEDLSHKRLLRDFGAPEQLADEMLEDKVTGISPDGTDVIGDKVSARRDVTEPETIATLERCFRLLTGNGAGGRRKSSVSGGGLASASTSGSGSSNSPGKHSSSGGGYGGSGTTLLGRCLRRSVFEAVKCRITRMDHNLLDVIWPAIRKLSNIHGSQPQLMLNASSASLDEASLRERRLSVSSYDEDFTGNVVAPDLESYEVFTELLDPLIRDLHCVTVTGELPLQPSPRFFHHDEDGPPPLNDTSRSALDTIEYLETRDLDPSGKFVLAGVVECSRNLESFQLPLTMRISELENCERMITGALMAPELSGILAQGSSEDEAGTYYTLSEIADPFNEVRAKLAASGLLLPLTECENSCSATPGGDERKLHGRHWPYGRGVYVASAADLAIWINVRDHVRVICCTNEQKPSLIGKAYVRLARVVNVLDRIFKFSRHPKLGFLTSRPCAIGNTLRFDIIVRFPGLSKKPDDLKHLCVVRGLRIHPTLRRDTVRVGNQQSLSIGELQTYHDFDRALSNVLTLEKEMALNSSLKIATVIANIFKRRRLSSTRSIRA